MTRDYEPSGLCDPIKWEGGPAPLPPETAVIVTFRDGLTSKARRVKTLNWEHSQQMDDIVSYQYWPDDLK